MTTKSEQIRILARAGHSVAEIARRLDLKYQHAYNVCRQAGLTTNSASKTKDSASISRPPLTVEQLIAGGFKSSASWTVKAGVLICPLDLPKTGGVYAFATEGHVVYVGLASISLARRLYHYGRPGPSQKTNIRLNEIIQHTIASGAEVEVYTACPPSFEWNGFTISGAEGLEAGLIREYSLPWNVRGAS